MYYLIKSEFPTALMQFFSVLHDLQCVALTCHVFSSLWLISSSDFSFVSLVQVVEAFCCQAVTVLYAIDEVVLTKGFIHTSED